MPALTASSADIALQAFAPGIDWGRTFLLFGTVAILLLTAGAVAATALVRRLGSPRQPSTPIPSAAMPRPSTYPGSAPVESAPSHPPPVRADSDAVASLRAQRAALIHGCLKIRGLLDDDIAADVLTDALRGGGVRTFDPTGMAMDPLRHRVDHTVPAPSAQADGFVAETLVPGFVDDNRLLRPAEVVVFKWAAR